MTRVITMDEQDAWVTCVRQCAHYDFYHSWSYHVLHLDQGVPLLFVYEEGENFIAMPFLKRSIPGTDHFDMTSVYGYGGPISNLRYESLDLQLILGFKAGLLLFLEQQQIVSVFARLHPFFNQRLIMDHFDGITNNGKVVALDLGIAIEEQRAQYQERVQRKIRQLRKRGYHVREGKTSEDIRVFSAIYNDNMLRLQAADSYLFDEAYFEQMLSSKEYDARLLFVNDESGDPVCAAIVVFTNDLIQAHLLGTRAEYRAESPAKLLIDEVTLMGRQKGMRYYNLGGGLSYKEDSLYEWKRSFSRSTFEFHSWRLIVDPAQYNYLLHQMGVDASSQVDFFPLYRNETAKV
ncbi:hypothetical protein PBAL39_01997 [Pedobacter sp. BAL39]|uniref:GNAT family N-acetyltransferase n=1 Tax=Pedobacter sp. BAL39 TaxID=391596 RepID=UPI0001559B97|nr:GNAT family N-acetyltransferase [Pedobacter sp. BAL39]EDM38348.1 hypothetical protein PBAL39_01997 [Pedobacter sp. BAL39]